MKWWQSLDLISLASNSYKGRRTSATYKFYLDLIRCVHTHDSSSNTAFINLSYHTPTASISSSSSPSSTSSVISITFDAGSRRVCDVGVSVVEGITSVEFTSFRRLFRSRQGYEASDGDYSPTSMESPNKLSPVPPLPALGTRLS